MELITWIADYADYLKSNGYACRTVGRRLKHLRCLSRFMAAKGLQTLEEFDPQLAIDLTDYWVAHQPGAKISTGCRRIYRFQPHHHLALQYSLRSFFRWLHSTGRLQHDVFPWKPQVRGSYLMPAVADYLHFCKEHKGLAKNTWAQIELLVRRFDQFLHTDQLSAWNQIQSRHIDLFVRQQADKNIKRIQRVHKILRGLFRYLFSLGLVEQDWGSALRSPRQYTLAHVPQAVRPDQVLRLLDSLDRNQRGGKRDFAMILMAASLGVRASEIAGLRLDDLDWRQGVVRFNQVKNRKDLWMPLSRPLVEALVSYLENERPRLPAQRTVFLRLNPPWVPLTPRALAGVMRKRMHLAGIAASGHQLRHGFASELLRVGVNFSTLQELLGHSHITSTRIYTKIDLVQLREVAENDAEDY